MQRKLRPERLLGIDGFAVLFGPSGNFLELVGF
jgi:hypothetical protein